MSLVRTFVHIGTLWAAHPIVCSIPDFFHILRMEYPIAPFGIYLQIVLDDIPSRSISVKLSDEELAARPQQPLKRNRTVSKALRAYAQSVSSADKGGVRVIED